MKVSPASSFLNKKKNSQTIFIQVSFSSLAHILTLCASTGLDQVLRVLPVGPPRQLRDHRQALRRSGRGPAEGRSLSMCLTDVCLLPPAGRSFQWEFVHGLLESAIYGGRIDNPSDLRILRSYLEQFFSSQLFSSSSSSGSAAHRKSRGGTRFFPPQISLPNSCSIAVRRRAINFVIM